MDRHPLDVERLIGRISFALGASALQPNDSTFYRLVEASDSAGVWLIGAFCFFGIAMEVSTRRNIPRCRIALLSALLMTWVSGFGMVFGTTRILGAFGAIAIVIIFTILTILWTKANVIEKIKVDDP